MGNVLRLLAAALLALAIPIQGAASVIAGQCMAFGHHQDAGTQGHAHGYGDSGADRHDHAPQSDPDKSSHCGPCTACCASVTIAAPAAVPALSSPSNTKYFFSQFPPLAAEPHELDRPPLAL